MPIGGRLISWLYPSVVEELTEGITVLQIQPVASQCGIWPDHSATLPPLCGKLMCEHRGKANPVRSSRVIGRHCNELSIKKAQCVRVIALLVFLTEVSSAVSTLVGGLFIYQKHYTYFKTSLQYFEVNKLMSTLSLLTVESPKITNLVKLKNKQHHVKSGFCP